MTRIFPQYPAQTGYSGVDGAESLSFDWQRDQWVPATVTDPSIPVGAGAMVSTATETAQFFRALLTGELLGEAMLTRMQTFDGPFGYGLLEMHLGEHRGVGHNGGIDGFLSSAAHFPGPDITFALTLNGVNYNFNEILAGFATLVAGTEYDMPDFSLPTAITLTPAQMQAYTGHYVSPDAPIDLRILVEDGQLMGQASGQSAFPLMAVDEHVLLFETADVRLEFDPMEDGRFERFTFSQRAMRFEFSRAEEP